MKKVCFTCKKNRKLNWYCKNKSKKDGLSTECRDCRKKYMNKYREANILKLNEMNRIRNKQRHYEAKLKVLAHYSNGTMKCQCPGCDVYQLEFLSIDHVNGGGTQHRNTFKGARTFYEFLVKEGYPEGLMTLCYNCNLAKGFFGKCPHQANL